MTADQESDHYEEGEDLTDSPQPTNLTEAFDEIFEPGEVLVRANSADSLSSAATADEDSDEEPAPSLIDSDS